MMDTPPLLNFYAFTLNPDPTRYKSHDPVDQYKALLNCIFAKKYMKHTFEEFVFYPELTLNGNVHIHGCYKLKDRVKYNRWFLPACKQWGFVLVKDKIDDDWLIYVMKESEKGDLECLFEGLPYPLTEDNIDDYKKDVRVKTVMNMKMMRNRKNVLDFLK